MEAEPASELAGLRLLVVEDHGEIAELMVLMLGALGHRAESAGTVAAAVDRLRSAVFDLILADFRLPDGTGADLLERVGQPRPLAILLSAFPRDAIEPRHRAGFAEVLEKPVEMDALARAIEAVGRPRRVNGSA